MARASKAILFFELMHLRRTDEAARDAVYQAMKDLPLERDPHRAGYNHRERVGATLEAIARGAADRAWSVRREIDGGLRWDADRQVWVGEDGFAYDGSRFFDYSRTGAAWGEGA
jgi:hypothetical protein